MSRKSRDKTDRDYIKWRTKKDMREILERRFPEPEERRRFQVKVDQAYLGKSILSNRYQDPDSRIFDCEDGNSAVCKAYYLRNENEMIDMIDVLYQFHRKDENWLIKTWYIF